MAIKSGVTAILNGGYIDETPGMGDGWNVNFAGSTSALVFDRFFAGTGSNSFIYNANFIGDGSMSVNPGCSVVAGAFPGFTTTLIAPCKVTGFLYLGYSQQGSPGITTVNFTNGYAGIVSEGVGGVFSGEVDVYAAPTAATLVGSNSQGIKFQTTADGGGTIGTLNFLTNQPGIPADQTVYGYVENSTDGLTGGGNVNFQGGSWKLQDEDTSGYSISMTSGTLGVSSSPSTTSATYIQMSGNAIIDTAAVMNVFAMSSWQPLASTTINGKIQITNLAPITMFGTVYLNASSVFNDWFGGGSGGVGSAGMIFDPNGNVEIAAGATIKVQVLPGSTVPPSTVYTIIGTNSVAGITGDFNNPNLPPNMTELNKGNKTGERDWQITS